MKQHLSFFGAQGINILPFKQSKSCVKNEGNNEQAMNTLPPLLGTSIFAPLIRFISIGINRNLFIAFCSICLLSIPTVCFPQTSFAKRCSKGPRQLQNKTTIPNEIFFHADLLVWDSREEGLEYAYRNSGSQTNQDLKCLEPSSKFQPGFRLAMGGFLPYDQWNIGAIYTFYHSKRRSSAHSEFDPGVSIGPGIIGSWNSPTAFGGYNSAARFSFAENTWKLGCSFLDVALRRTCGISSRFSLEPSFGIRSAWIHQHYRVNYTGGNTIPLHEGQLSDLSSHILMNCLSNNVGLLFGCNLEWIAAKHWNIFTHLSSALLASHFHVERSESNLFLRDGDFSENELLKIKTSYWSFRPEAQIALGLRFLDQFKAGSKFIHYQISASYEAEIWWKQNQLLRYIDALTSTNSGTYTAPVQGNLMFQGLVLSAKFDY